MTAAPDILYRQAAALWNNPILPKPRPCCNRPQSRDIRKLLCIGQPSAAKRSSGAGTFMVGKPPRPNAIPKHSSPCCNNANTTAPRPDSFLTNMPGWVSRDTQKPTNPHALPRATQRSTITLSWSLPPPDMPRPRITIWHAIINAKATLRQPSNNTKKRPRSA